MPQRAHFHARTPTSVSIAASVGEVSVNVPMNDTPIVRELWFNGVAAAHVRAVQLTGVRRTGRIVPRPPSFVEATLGVDQPVVLDVDVLAAVERVRVDAAHDRGRIARIARRRGVVDDQLLRRRSRSPVRRLRNASFAPHCARVTIAGAGQFGLATTRSADPQVDGPRAARPQMRRDRERGARAAPRGGARNDGSDGEGVRSRRSGARHAGHPS